MNMLEREILWEQMRKDGWEYGELLGIEGGGYYAILIGEISRIFHSPQEYATFMQDRQANVAFEAIVAVYGIPSSGSLTEQQAMSVFDLLKSGKLCQAIETPDGKIYSLVDSRIEGDREQGRVVAIFAEVKG